MHQNRPVKEVGGGQTVVEQGAQTASCAICVLGGFEGPTGQTQKTWSDLHVPMSHPMSCA